MTADAGRAAKLDCEVVRTESGAPAVRDRTSGEVMHPFGPGREAAELYVEPSRLAARLQQGGPPLVLFDVGLGAASNAIAAWRVSASLPDTARRLEIVSFEHDLGALALALTPEHRDAFALSAPDAHGAATALLETGRHETARTTWRLRLGDLDEQLAREPAASADVVFWDMFSPTATPRVWTAAIFQSLHQRCRAGATVHTHNAATSTRAALLLAGFAVGVGEQSGGRGRGTVAAMDVADLAHPLDARWLARLDRSTAPYPIDVVGPDAPGTARHAIGLHRQFVDATPGQPSPRDAK